MANKKSTKSTKSAKGAKSATSAKSTKSATSAKSTKSATSTKSAKSATTTRDMKGGKGGMSGMPPMLGFTVSASMYSGNNPFVVVGSGRNGTSFYPQNPPNDCYWICIINAKNPREKIKDWVVPGSSNSTVPSGLDTYMSDPDYLFVITTKTLSTLHVPQGSFYNYLVKYGAGRQLQRLEQVNAVLSCGTYSTMSYILAGQCGPRGGPNPPPSTYELGAFASSAPVLMLMSLMPMPNGGPPWSICDCNSW